MNNTTSITRTVSSVETNVGTELSKVGVATMALSGLAVSCWAAACLLVGTVSSGGPMGLVSDFVSAFAG